MDCEGQSLWGANCLEGELPISSQQTTQLWIGHCTKTFCPTVLLYILPVNGFNNIDDDLPIGNVGGAFGRLVCFSFWSVPLLIGCFYLSGSVSKPLMLPSRKANILAMKWPAEERHSFFMTPSPPVTVIVSKLWNGNFLYGCQQPTTLWSKKVVVCTSADSRGARVLAGSLPDVR